MKLAGLSCIFNQWPQSKHLKCELEKPVCFVYTYLIQTVSGAARHIRTERAKPTLLLNFYFLLFRATSVWSSETLLCACICTGKCSSYCWKAQWVAPPQAAVSAPH